MNVKPDTDTVQLLVCAIEPADECNGRRVHLGPDPDDPWLSVDPDQEIAVGDIVTVTIPRIVSRIPARRCRECGCTDMDCSDCVERTGVPCYWIEADLCSACAK
jgi:hypothetical protein